VVVDGAEALSHLAGDVLLAIAVTGDEPLPTVGDRVGRLVQIRHNAGWADIAAALTYEIVLRAQAQRRVVEVENRLRESERFVALGRFIVEARHGLANALTGVLGNSELVLLETKSGLRDEVRGQLETIHSMSLKIHETLQKLSSLDREMQMTERRAERKASLEPAEAAG
jgi:signal transduction histidine kinase